MTAERKKTFILGAAISADSLEEAWDAAVGHLPANATPEQGRLAAAAGIQNFSLVEVASMLSLDYGEVTAA